MVRVLAVLLAVSVLFGCGSSSDSNEPLSNHDWRREIDFLTQESERIHPNLFHSISRSEYLAAADALKASIPSLTVAEIFTGLKRLVALPAKKEDGHSLITMFQATGFRLYPLRMYEFVDGVFVIDAIPPHQHAIGQRVVQIGGKDITQVNAILDPLITRDNETHVKQKRTLHYVVPEILEAMGVIMDAGQGDYLIEDQSGNFSTLQVAPIDKEEYRNTLQNSTGLPQNTTPLTMSDLSTAFWMQLMPGDNALYIKYNWVFRETAAGLTIAQFSTNVSNSVTTNNVQKIVVDIRHNGGGDATTYAPLLNVLSGPQINQAGKLYVIIGRSTFSAAANFATELDLGTNTRFAGEPTGGSLNNFGDVQNFDLPRSGFGISIPTIYWVYAPGDARTSIEPDIPVEWTSADYFNQLDPVLQAVLND